MAPKLRFRATVNISFDHFLRCETLRRNIKKVLHKQCFPKLSLLELFDFTVYIVKN